MPNLVELGFACGGLDSIGVESHEILQILVVWKKSPSDSKHETLGLLIWSLTVSRRSLTS